MAKKTRLYTLAKEAGMASKDFLAACEKSGLKFKSTLVTVDDKTASKIRSSVSGGGGRSAPKKKKKSASSGTSKKTSAKKSPSKKKSAKKKTATKEEKVKKAVKADPSLIGGYRPVKIETPPPAKEEAKADAPKDDKSKEKKGKGKGKGKASKDPKGPKPSPAAKDGPEVTASGTPKRSTGPRHSVRGRPSANCCS